MKVINIQHGGVRENAGRKAIFGESSVRMRVPESIAPTVSTALAAYRTAKAISQLGLVPVMSPTSELVIQSFATRVSAGFPSPADDYLEEGIDLNRMLVANAPATFFYTVEKDADSMNEVGIMGGDRIVVDRSIEARSGMIVLALIMGEGATVKELEIRGQRVRLIPRSTNPQHKPRTIGEGEELNIVGVVTWGLTQFNKGCR